MASSVSSAALVFSVRRCDPELVRPAKPTPREVKQLSDIDDQEGLRFHVPLIMFYPSNPLIKGKEDPVKVIREALGKALVYYYPFAGRLIEGENRKLMVDCTGEGVLFIEADADTTLDNLGDAIQPMCPCFEELLYDVPGTGEILGSPLILIQVTRLRCGGFVFALRLNHTMADGPGLLQFLNAISDMAKGLSAPSIQPIWQRELLNARNPPRITHIHYEYEEVNNTNNTLLMAMDDNVHRSFFFGPKEIRALRNQLPSSLGPCSTFEVLMACVWKCRTIAFAIDPDEVVRFSCLINIRGKRGFDLPLGYYGNAFVYPASITKAGMLCSYPLEYGIRLLKKAKAEISKEYVKSVADLMVIKGRPLFMQPGNYIVSDLTRVGFGDVDFGLGKKAIFGGAARALSIISFCMRFKNRKGEEGNVIPICLPPLVMERFEQELKKMTKEVEPNRLITSML